MNLLIIRDPTEKYGLNNHISCAWLQEKLPWAKLHWQTSTVLEIPDKYEGVVLMSDQARRFHTNFEMKDAGFVHIGHRHLRPQVMTYDIEAAWHFQQKDEEEEVDSDSKDTTETQPKNRLFWILSDVSKLYQYKKYEAQEPVLYPPLGKLCAKMRSVRNQHIVLDIETRRSDKGLSCIGFSSVEENTPPIVVPIYRYNNQLAYDPSEVYNFIRSLGIMLCNNIVVGHNIAFDLGILCGLYKIPFGTRIEDTMLMHHGIFLEAEKSLGHVIRRWANFPWHKDMNIEVPRNSTQEIQHWTYNALDVHRTKCVWLTLRDVARNNPALASSMQMLNQANAHYLVSTLHGMHVDASLLATAKVEAQRRARQLLRICRLLADKPDFNPASSVQCVRYFHDKLCYKVVARTESGAPKLGAKELYLLASKYNNPLLQLIIFTREALKEQSFLEFKPWKL